MFIEYLSKLNLQDAKTILVFEDGQLSFESSHKKMTIAIFFNLQNYNQHGA
jgi:hypothetical protein